jgi:hypothetical protein
VQQPHRSYFAKQEGAPQNSTQMLHNVEPGTYEAEIMCHVPPWWVESARVGATDLLRENLVIAPGSDLQPIEVVLRNDGASLMANVAAGIGAPRTDSVSPGSAAQEEIHAEVFAVSDRDPAHPVRYNDRQNQQYHFTVLPPGKYRLFAFDTVEGLDLGDPNAFQEYASRAAQVTLEPNDNKNVMVELITRGEP